MPKNYECDYVICSVPLGVLKFNSIEFNPALPRYKQDSIENVGFGTVTKLALKFKSKHLHDLFKAEWKIDLAREAVKNAVIKVYGDKIKLVLEEPEEEKKNNADGTNILDSSIVKSALAMGAKIEEEKEG